MLLTLLGTGQEIEWSSPAKSNKKGFARMTEAFEKINKKLERQSQPTHGTFLSQLAAVVPGKKRGFARMLAAQENDNEKFSRQSPTAQGASLSQLAAVAPLAAIAPAKSAEEKPRGLFRMIEGLKAENVKRGRKFSGLSAADINTHNDRFRHFG